MTATSYLEKVIAIPLDTEPRTDALTFRPGNLEDIPRLAELFQVVYEQTTHS